MEDIADNKLHFKYIFENPTSVSIGMANDIMIAEVIDETFFCSSDSPRSIKKGTKIKT